MENYQQQQQPFSNYTVIDTNSNVDTQAASKKFIANVFLWMFAALAISTVCAYLFATTPSLLSTLTQAPSEANPHGGLSALGWVVLLAPFGFILIMQFGLNRLSVPALTFLFLLFAAVMGISLSFVLVAYTSGSVIGCFASASAMFGIMAFMGYTTTKDLTSFGRLMMMGLIGILVSFFINFFLHSAQLDYLISIIGVMVFTGLTAYDVQVLKRIGAGTEYEGVSADDTKKASIMGALRLYLDFINLFLMLLRLFGRRK